MDRQIVGNYGYGMGYGGYPSHGMGYGGYHHQDGAWWTLLRC